MSSSITNFFIVIIFSFIASASFSFDSQEKETAYTHLHEINKEWENHHSIAPIKLVEFENDIDRISFHLHLVVKELRNNIPNRIKGKALVNRLKLLTDLELYADQKVFPTNLYHSERTPYFIDDFGVHCAVGYLIMKSGHSELSNQIRDEHNYDYIQNIETSGVTEWANEFGFELDELAWIQPGYSSESTFSTLGGANGEVTVMCKDYSNNRLIYAGDFTEIDGGTACSGIGYYQGGTIHCLGGGLEGTINHVYESQGSIYVSGLLNSGGTDYSQAILTNGTWTYLNIPGLEGIEARTGMAGSSDYKREIVIMNDQGSNEHEVWRLSNADVWEKQATAIGEINSIALGDAHLAYGGAFTSLTLHLSAGDQTLSSTNACLRENTGENWSALTGQVADTVNVVKWLNNNFFFGGIDDAYPNGVVEPFAAISMIHNDTLAGLYGGMSGSGGYKVNIQDIDVVSDFRIVVCGTFGSGSIGFYGSNLGIVDYTNFTTNVGTGWETVYTEALGTWSYNTSLNAAVIVEQTLFVGGDFQYAPSGTEPGPLGGTTILYSEMNNMAQLNMPLSVASNDLPSFKVFPNPATNHLTIESEFQLETVSFLDMNGRPVLEQKGKTGIIDITSLSSGTYLVKVISENGQVSHQRVVLK